MEQFKSTEDTPQNRAIQFSVLFDQKVCVRLKNVLENAEDPSKGTQRTGFTKAGKYGGGLIGGLVGFVVGLPGPGVKAGKEGFSNIGETPNSKEEQRW